MRQKVFRLSGWLSVLLILLLCAVEGFNPSAANTYVDGMNSASIFPLKFALVKKDARPSVLALEDYQAIRHSAREFNVDYKLILALIKQESDFNHDAESDRGAIGIMQLMPETHAEVIEAMALGDEAPSAGNIKAGVYYFAKLYDLFKNCEPYDRACLSLAAYNAGPARVYDAQELAAYIGENPCSWSAIKDVMPLLSKRCYSLHQAVWKDGKPRSGYFGSYRQTIAYVDNVMEMYGKLTGTTTPK